MAITITPVTDLPNPPLKTDPVNFAARADAFLGALPDFGSELNAAITELNKLTSGLDQQTPIAAYVDTTTYNFPNVVAGSDGHSYRCVGTDVLGIDPTTDDGTNWVRLTGGAELPEGSIVPYLPGYFTDGANGGFTAVLAANDVASINALVNPIYHVGDGSELNDSKSNIYNGPGRYLPLLTDERFIMGDTAAGGAGGNNAMAHTHSISHNHASFTTGSTTLSTSQIPSHRHGVDSVNPGGRKTDDGAYSVVSTESVGVTTNYTGGSGSHSHSVNPPSHSGTSGAASATENRPKFLSCYYLIKVR